MFILGLIMGLVIGMVVGTWYQSKIVQKQPDQHAEG